MGKSGIVVKKCEGEQNENYHDIAALFAIYRQVTWQMQAKLMQVKRRFNKEYGTDVDSFLEC